MIFRVIIPTISIISTVVFTVLKITKKKKIFFLGIFGSLGIGIISFVFSIIIQIILFFVAGMLRPMLPILAKNELNVKDYTYKTIIENEPDYNHSDTKIEEDICEFSYGFLKYPYTTKATVDNELIAREGPPFTYLLDFNHLNHNIESIYIKNAEIISSNGTKNLFDRGTIDIQIYNIFWDMPTRNGSFLKKFLKERTLNISSLYEPMRKTANKQKKYSSKDELENSINNTNTMLRLYFKHAPIDILTDIIIEINFELVFYKNDGEIKNIIINNTYYQECFEKVKRSITPLEKLPTEDEAEW
jgi:hypothetical protein